MGLQIFTFCRAPVSLAIRVLSHVEPNTIQACMPEEKKAGSDSVQWRKPLYQQKIQQPIDNTKTPSKTLITQQLQTNLGQSVGVTTASLLVPSYQKDTRLLTSLSEVQSGSGFAGSWTGTRAFQLGDNTFVIEWFPGINCIILRSQI